MTSAVVIKNIYCIIIVVVVIIINIIINIDINIIIIIMQIIKEGEEGGREGGREGGTGNRPTGTKHIKSHGYVITCKPNTAELQGHV